MKIARKWYIGSKYETAEMMRDYLASLENGEGFADSRATGDIVRLPVTKEVLSENILELVLRYNGFKRNPELNGNTVGIFHALKIIAWQIQEIKKGADSEVRESYESYSKRYDLVPPLWDDQI